jgi:uncharacterized membrane protein
MSSETLSRRQSPALPKRAMVFLFLAVSLVGFVNAAYLTAKHYLGTPPACSLFAGCEKVTTSRYATILGVPLALLGALYYLAVFLAVVAYVDTGRVGIFRGVAGFTAVGFVASAWFVYLQLFVIQAICQYCMLSAFTSTLLFIFGITVLRSAPSRA